MFSPVTKISAVKLVQNNLRQEGAKLLVRVDASCLTLYLSLQMGLRTRLTGFNWFNVFSIIEALSTSHHHPPIRSTKISSNKNSIPIPLQRIYKSIKRQMPTPRPSPSSRSEHGAARIDLGATRIFVPKRLRQ